MKTEDDINKRKVISVTTELLKSWHDVTNSKFIDYLIKFQLHFNLSLFDILYLMNILTYISCVVYDLGELEVSWKIKVMSSLQVDDLFTSDLWT